MRERQNGWLAVSGREGRCIRSPVLYYDAMFLERATVKTQDGVIEGTARDIMAQLALVPPGERVRVMVGRPSLSVIARRLQAVAAAKGMTEDIHDDLLRSLKNDG